jgi:hypothetical protein
MIILMERIDKMAYKINIENEVERCAKCDKIVLRDSHDEHILLDYDDEFCICEDIY